MLKRQTISALTNRLRSMATASTKSKAPAPAAEAPNIAAKFHKNDDFGQWYSRICLDGEMCEYSGIKGCIIIKPTAMYMWTKIRNFINDHITDLGVQDVYFPLFVNKSSLAKEQAHLEGFAAEVCWIAAPGDEHQEDPVALRPTSECIMYPSFAKWIRSHRQLPLKVNQWANVVRWETTHTMPFIRGREFLWQEGHTAHATREGAVEEVWNILDMYSRVYSDLLAIPCQRGKKTESEKFAGADFTTTVEIYVPVAGRSIQGGTSHHLGQNFSKMFNIVYEDDNNQRNHVHQNSWGLSTRSLGTAVMVHSDDLGLVLPPRVAPTQVVVMPVGIGAKTTAEIKEKLVVAVDEVVAQLTAARIRCKADKRDNVSPGSKFNEYEIVGVPLRLEIGPRDLEAKKAMACRRDTGKKEQLELADIVTAVQGVLDGIHTSLYEKAGERRQEHTKVVEEWKDFTPLLNEGNILLSPWCGVEECEKEIQNASAQESVAAGAALSSGAKSLCIPEPPGPVEGKVCVKCGKPAQHITLWGRAY